MNIVKKLNASVRANVRFALFVVFAVVTLAAPLSIIWKYESALHYGTQFKFRTQPVDPVDAFRGRYVTLSFKDDWAGKLKNVGPMEADFLYVRLKCDADGFAVPGFVSLNRLSGDDVITATNARRRLYGDKWEWHFDYPFDRYYLPEDVAPMAEQLYREANIRGGASSRDGDSAKADTYVTVRVRNGVGVIEELYLNGVPVREAVRAQMRK